MHLTGMKSMTGIKNNENREASVRRCSKIDKALWALGRRTSTAWTA